MRKNLVRIGYIAFIYNFTFSQGFWGNEFPEPKIKYEPETYVCYKATKPILVDGKLDDPVWAEIDFTNSFVDIEGSLKPKPFYDTKVKMTWDENYFYFGAVMEEPHVWGSITARDAVIFKDNDFEIFLDPDGDTHNYYELEVNVLETEWDLLLLKPYHDGQKVAVDSWCCSFLFEEHSIKEYIIEKHSQWNEELIFDSVDTHRRIKPMNCPLYK